MIPTVQIGNAGFKIVTTLHKGAARKPSIGGLPLWRGDCCGNDLVRQPLTFLTFLVLLGAEVTPALAQGNRAQIVAALERLIATGRPAHVEHDEGERLQRDLNALLAAGDLELLELARRASAPIVAFVSHPIAARSGLPYVGIETRRVLDAPAPESYGAMIAVSIDGGPWTALCDVTPSSSCGRNVQQLPRPASAPGFHQLRFQALVRHENGQVETRALSPVSYGIMGVARGTPQREDPAVFVRAAAAVTARSLDASLPDVTVSDWLRSLHGPGSSLEAARWESQWCGLGTRAHLLELEGQQVCVAGQLQVAETKLVVEVRIRVGRLEWSDGRPRWIAEVPAIDTILVRGGGVRWLSSLAQLADVFRAPVDAWPAPRISMDPADIDFTPEPTRKEAGTFVVRATLRNAGDAQAYGVAVVLMGVTQDFTQGPVLRRRFVIDLPARGSAVLRERVSYPHGYGAIIVQIHFTGDGGPFSDGLSDEDAWGATVFRVVNPEAAPPAFAKWVGDTLCANQCRGY
jgi:hypothetical protein